MTSFSDYMHKHGVYGHKSDLLALERMEATVRQRLRERGYRLMHRRKEQFWVVLDKPMTLYEIDQLWERGMLPDVSRSPQAAGVEPYYTPPGNSAVIEAGKGFTLGSAV